MVIVSPSQFEGLLNLFFLAIGLDFTVSGYCVLRDKSMKHVPRFVGFLCLKLFARAENLFAKRRGRENVLTKLARTMYTVRAAGIYLAISGPLLILISLSALVS